MRRFLPLLGLLLASCGSPPDDSAGPSPDEDRQLNEAAASLDVDAPAPAESSAP